MIAQDSIDAVVRTNGSISRPPVTYSAALSNNANGVVMADATMARLAP